LALRLRSGFGRDLSWVESVATVYPTGETSTLPPHLKLTILTETGQVFREVIATDNDEFIRYRFDAELGDKFFIEVALESARVTEYLQV
jgi:hypothetical protein